MKAFSLLLNAHTSSGLLICHLLSMAKSLVTLKFFGIVSPSKTNQVTVHLITISIYFAHCLLALMQNVQKDGCKVFKSLLTISATHKSNNAKKYSFMTIRKKYSASRDGSNMESIANIL